MAAALAADLVLALSGTLTPPVTATASAAPPATASPPPPAAAWWKKKAPEPPPLPKEHVHPSGGFSFRTPESWVVEALPANPDAIQVGGDGVLVRFVFRRGEQGYDSLHASCMMERLAGPMDTDAAVVYERDFADGIIGDRRAIESIFTVRYDHPILGHREWRQRNLTIVGGGQSLCAIGYAPAAVWKKSPPTRTLLNAVLSSVTFRKAP